MKPQSSADVDWTGLQTFLELASSGGAANAAERLGIDVTTVRRRLARLEQATGLTLVNKSGRSLHLTDDGERLRDIVSQMAELSKAISRDATDALRDLVGGSCSTPPAHWHVRGRARGGLTRPR